MVASVLNPVRPVVQERPEAPVTAAIETITPHRLFREHYDQLLGLPTDALRQRAAEEIRRELAQGDDGLREAVHRRLTTWLDLDPEDARILARVWDEAAAMLPVDEARRRFDAECDAMLHGMRFEDFTRLVEIMPWLRSHFGLALVGQHAMQEELPQAA